MSFRDLLLSFMNGYFKARTSEPFKGHPLHQTMKEMVKSILDLPCVQRYVPPLKVDGGIGQGSWAMIPWVCLLDPRVTTSIQEGVYVVYLFSTDMSYVYLTLNQGVTKVYNEKSRAEARTELRKRALDLRNRNYIRNLPGFKLDWNIDLKAESGVGAKYIDSTIAYKAYSRDFLPDDDELEKDLEILLKAYEQYAENLNSTPSSGIGERISAENISAENDEKNSVNNNNSRLALLISELYKRVSMRGFFYPEDDFRTFCVSLKTKPFVLLTGISGTGKTRLVELVARQFEGAREYTIPVRPDWSDSSDLLGYRDIQGNFRPGPLLEILREANENPTRPFFICLDEMNLARVEHYFAEFLSVIEKRELRNGKISTPPVVGHYAGDGPWSKVYVSDNVFLIGTVNMDETTHPFSRKVLDRANILEFNKIELTYHPSGYAMSARLLSEWEPLRPSYCRLPEFYSKDPEMFEKVISMIKEINVILEPGLFHVGYRVRDEICLFMLHAKEAGFEEFLALDMQILSKILPRVQGSSATVRRILLGIWNWATGLEVSEDDPELLYKIADLPEGNRFPKTAEKVKIMLQRLEEDGYTSFWV